MHLSITAIVHRLSREGGQAGAAEDKWPELPQLWVRAGELRVMRWRHQQLCYSYTHHLRETATFRAPKCRNKVHMGEVTCSWPHN